VLIHTDLENAALELGRVLKPGAPIAIAEPLTSNPLVQLYRYTLAPREWQGITRYFDPAGTEVRTLENHLGPLQQERWYGLSFLAFFFQFALHSVFLWRISLLFLLFLDQILHRLSPSEFRRKSWFITLRGTRGAGPGSGFGSQ
jgi:hypothetical protein